MNEQLENAIRLLRSGDAGRAIAQCRAVLTADPVNAQALHVCGLAQRQLGQLEEATQLLARSIELEPANPEFRTNLAQLLGARDQVDASSAQFERALAIAPHFRP